MNESQSTSKDRMWCCLHCRSDLIPNGNQLRCESCGRQYPVISGIPLLVKNPSSYLRIELAALSQASNLAKAHREQLKHWQSAAILPQASIDRHNDVAEAEIAQADMLFSLLEPVSGALAAEAGEELSTHRSGWTFEALLPYLIRDWTNTAELTAAKSLIGEALREIFSGSSGQSLAIAGCGAGGLMTGLPSSFEYIVGFDLALPILGAARHLLDGKSLDVPLPRAIQKDGRIRLSPQGQTSADSRAIVVAMDALDTAFGDGTLDCVITSFLIDLVPNPKKIAKEIHRILAPGGVWINYGPSGPLKATWRFDNAESGAFFETFGFLPIYARSHRTTFLDLSRDLPSRSSRAHTCYLSAARKTNRLQVIPKAPKPMPPEIMQAIPQHYPSASFIRRQSLGPERKLTTVLRFERLPGKMESAGVGDRDIAILELVDGKRTVREIADLLSHGVPALSPDMTARYFTRYFELGLLLWQH